MSKILGGFQHEEDFFTAFNVNFVRDGLRR